jgi:hypothetical protein
MIGFYLLRAAYAVITVTRQRESRHRQSRSATGISARRKEIPSAGKPQKQWFGAGPNQSMNTNERKY